MLQLLLMTTILLLLNTNDVFLNSVERIDLSTFECPPVTQQYWLRSLGLTSSDRDCRGKGRWLTDRIIEVGQNLLKHVYPKMGGLQPPTLGEVLNFSSQDGEFVQVIHTAGNHWVTVSNIGFEEGTVGIYDSLPSRLSLRLKENVATIMHTSKFHIMLDLQDVQEQRSSSDCELFALAFATSLCAGEDLTT